MKWRFAGVAAVAAFVVLVARFWHPVYGFTAFLQLDASGGLEEIAAFRERPVFVYRDTGGYDGRYYAQIACHPLLEDAGLRPATDNLAYRARRILPPALAWLLGAGRPRLIIAVYSILNAAIWLVFAALLWRILGVADGRGWTAWAGVLFSAGAIASVRFALTDLPAAALTAAAVWSLERNRGGWAAGMLAAAGLSRETAVAGLPALMRRPWLSASNAGRTILAVAPLAAWLGYVRWRVGPADYAWWNFDWPLAGLVEKGADCIGSLAGPVDPLLVISTILATAALAVQAGYIAARPDPADPWWRIGAGYGLMMMLLGRPVWEDYPGAAPRVLLPLTIAFNVLAVRRKAAPALLVAGNLGVAAGLLTLCNTPRDLREIAAAQVGDAAVVVRLEKGWSDREQNSRHVWAWCEGRGRVLLEGWPPGRRELELHFRLLSLDSRTVAVREQGRVVWEGSEGPGLVSVEFPVTLESGRAELDFSTDRPPVRKVPADPRPLAFAIYDLRMAMPAR